jgi:WD40 repeat protein
MTSQSVGELRGHRGAVNCLSAAGEVLASGGEDGTIRLWDIAAGCSTRALLSAQQRPVNAVCVGRGGCEHYVLAAAGREVFAYDLRAPGMVLRQPAVPSLGRTREEVSSLALDSSGRHVAIGDDSGEVRLVDLDGEAQLPAMQAAHGSICSCVQLRPSAGLELVSGGMDACILRWDGTTGRLLRGWSLAAPAEEQPAQLVNPRFVHWLDYAPGGACFAAALGDGSIELRGSEEGQVLACADDAHRAAASQVLTCPCLPVIFVPALGMYSPAHAPRSVRPIIPAIAPRSCRQAWAGSSLDGRRPLVRCTPAT